MKMEKKRWKNDQRNDKCNDNQNDKNEKYFKDFQCVAGSLFHKYRVRKIWTWTPQIESDLCAMRGEHLW